MPISPSRLSCLCVLGMLYSFQAFATPVPFSEQDTPLYVTGDGKFFLEDNAFILNFDASLLTDTTLLGATQNFSLDGRNHSLLIQGCQSPQQGSPLILAGSIPNSPPASPQTPPTTLSLQNFYSFNFNNNISIAPTGMINASEIVFDKNKNVLVSKNRNITNQTVNIPSGGSFALKLTPEGGALFAQKSTKITNTTDTIYFGHNYSTFGGAIRGDLDTHVLLLTNNAASTLFEANESTLSGGAIFGGSAYFSNNSGSIRFVENICSNTVVVPIGTNIQDANLGTGGAISLPKGAIGFSDNKGSIEFSKNTIKGRGGAIFAKNISFQDNTGPILFIGNSASEEGGAIHGENLSLKALNTTIFSENRASDGGAIFIKNVSPTTTPPPNGVVLPTSSLSLVAEQGSIFFNGNTSTNNNTLTRNAVSLEAGASLIALNAKENLTIGFYDPIIVNNGTGTPPPPPADLTINTTGYTGRILFSGETLSKKEKTESSNYTSKLPSAITLANGTLEITHGATLETKTFTQNSGSTVILGKGSTLKATNGTASPTITLTNLVIDLQTFDEEETTPPPQPPQIPSVTIEASNGGGSSSGSITLSSLTLKDPTGYFFYNQDREKEWTFELDLKGTTQPPSITISDPTRSSTDYGYQGTWNITNGTSTGKKTITWTPNGIFFLPNNRRGEVVPNTSWSLMTSIDTLATSAYDSPMETFSGRRVRVEGLGAFLRGKTENQKVDGFRYESSGYGVHLEAHRDRYSSGIAVGQLFGKTRSKHFNAKSKERTLIGAFYAGAPIPTRTIDAVASILVGYGYMENRLTTKYPVPANIPTPVSEGEWDDRGVLIRLRATTYMPSKYYNTMTRISGLRELALFLGADLSGVHQMPFVESGELPRSFAQGKVFAVAIPLGLVHQAHLHWAGNIILFRTAFTYKPDIYRNDPHTNMTLLENGRNYKVDGAKLPRNAFRLDMQGSSRFQPHMEFTASYSFEGRSNTFIHKISAGLGKVF